MFKSRWTYGDHPAEQILMVSSSIVQFQSISDFQSELKTKVYHGLAASQEFTRGISRVEQSRVWQGLAWSEFPQMMLLRQNLGALHCFTLVKILPANSEGCWIFSFVMFLVMFFSFGFVILLSFGFVIFCNSYFAVALFCHFFAIWLSFFVIVLPFCCHLCHVFGSHCLRWFLHFPVPKMTIKWLTNKWQQHDIQMRNTWQINDNANP